ncbi:MAG: hypothetical protein GXP44_03015 [bacterium]|nr:hypothetical protein [bacterium]
MKKIIIIGTIHGGFTPKEELEEFLSDINPDQVLVELSDEELNDRPRENSIRDEMFAAYDWATRNKKKADCFDIENNTLKKGVTGKEPEFLKFELKVKELLKDYSWKDLNKEEPWETPEVVELENKITEKYFNAEKQKEREHEMLDIVRGKLIDGVNAIITGAGHLSFFKKEIPEAAFPLQD